MRHTNPAAVLPPLTLHEARHFLFHHLRMVRRSTDANDARMVGFHKMRARYLSSAILMGKAL